MAREAFAVIREGMKGKAGIGKVALYGREYLVKVQPRERGLVMYTLRHANEIRSMDAIDELADMPAKVKPAEVELARQVMGTFEGELDFDAYRDEYQEGLREIIDAKIEGREIVAPEVEAPPKVVNLMEALRKSLDTISATKKKTAPAQARKGRGAQEESTGVKLLSSAGAESPTARCRRSRCFSYLTHPAHLPDLPSVWPFGDPPEDRGKGRGDCKNREAEQPQRAIENRLRFHSRVDVERRAGQPLCQRLLPHEDVAALQVVRTRVVIRHLARNVKTERHELVAGPRDRLAGIAPGVADQRSAGRA